MQSMCVSSSFDQECLLVYNIELPVHATRSLRNKEKETHGELIPGSGRDIYFNRSRFFAPYESIVSTLHSLIQAC